MTRGGVGSRGGEESEISFEGRRGCGFDAFFEPFGLPPFFIIDAEEAAAGAKEAGGGGGEVLEEGEGEAKAYERESQVKKSPRQMKQVKKVEKSKQMARVGNHDNKC